MPVASWVKGLVDEVCGPTNMAVGKTLQHPDGRMVKIVSGQYWGEHGISNFWCWRAVQSDGTLGAQESGYGWR